MAAVAADSATWQWVDQIVVFARMSPEEKGFVIKHLKDRGCKTLMCGDGGNDVGALKQADVGLALLSGWSNFNADTSKVESKQVVATDSDKAGLTSQEDAARKLKEVEAEVNTKFGGQRAKFLSEFNERRKALQAQQPERLRAEIAAMDARGESGLVAQAKAAYKVMQDIQSEMKKIQQECGPTGGKKDGGLLAAQAALMGGEEGDSIEDGSVPMVKLGDASIASPFTSKLPSIKSCLDIIRQGRCTLVNTMQQQQILMLNCMISAYSLAVRNLEGGRSSEAQLVSSGLLLTVAGLSFSFARPCDKLSPILPLKSVFHPAISLSIVGQLAIHLGSMIFCVGLVREELSDSGVKKQLNATKFRPNLYNTVIFLVQTMQQVSVMAVNYKGRPWMTGVTENQGLLYSLSVTGISMLVCVTEVFPTGNEYLGLVPLPNDQFRISMVATLLVSFFGALLWDRLCVFLFARRVFMASLDELRSLKAQDFVPVFKNAAMLLGGFLLFYSGGVWALIIVYFLYRKRQAGQQAAANAATVQPAQAPVGRS
jgi:cation-transporting ATPase 13A1